MSQNQQPQITLEEIGERFGRVDAQIYAQIITLEKNIAILREDNRALSVELVRVTAENEDLRERLHRAEVDLLAAQGKQIID